MSSFKAIDTVTSFRCIEKQIDEAVKSGRLPKSEACRILKNARENYRNQTVNKFLDRRGLLVKEK